MTTNINWRAVGLFYAIACAISWPLFVIRDFYPELWQLIPVPWYLRTALYMWGPGVAALVVWRKFGRTNHNRNTFFGTSLTRSLLLFVPSYLVLAAVMGRSFWSPETSGPLGYLLPFSSVFVMLGEELGWRGFLQEALRPMPLIARFALIGVMWELWHLPVRIAMAPQLGITLWALIPAGILFTTCLTFMIGLAVRRSHSLLVAIALHSWSNWSLDYGTSQLLLIMGCSAVFALYLLWTWDDSAETELEPITI